MAGGEGVGVKRFKMYCQRGSAFFLLALCVFFFFFFFFFWGGGGGGGSGSVPLFP